ncbi:MAG TPA: exosortase/archaeosortase family protein, partial [Chthoniobacterales bacterium]
YEWSLHEQYNYGWAVPFLGALLFYQRWGLKAPPSDPVPDAALAQAARWTLLVALLPVRVVQEANPDWRLLSWTLGAIVVAYTFLEIGRAGGMAWMRHFAFPICFPLVAVPWLAQVENAVVQSLTAAVAAVAVEIAGWSGVGAYQLGNVIQLKTGFVGVDEACSGVKTLQAAIMVSLFLGELLHLTTSRRFLLLAGGCAWVFACNIGRATALVFIASSRGLPEMEKSHDLIGTVVLVAGMAGLVAFGWLLSKPTSPSPDEAGAGAISFALRPAALLPIAWLALVFAATELWYQRHERRLVARAPWQASWPLHDGAREVPIADATRGILRYDNASSAAWQERAEATTWWGFFARWEARRTAVQLVRSHSPEICLPAVGRTFVRELAPVEFSEGELQLRFRAYEFLQEGQPLFVYVCIQEDKRAPGPVDAGAVEWSARGRLRAALAGERNLGQRLLELAVVGFPTAERASGGLIEAAREIVRPAVTD